MGPNQCALDGEHVRGLVLVMDVVVDPHCGGVVSARRDGRRAPSLISLQSPDDQSAKTIKTGLIAISQRFLPRWLARTELLRHPPRRREIALPFCKEGRLCRLHAADSGELFFDNTRPACGEASTRGKKYVLVHDCRRHYLLQCGGAAQLQHEPSSAIPWR